VAGQQFGSAPGLPRIEVVSDRLVDPPQPGIERGGTAMQRAQALGIHLIAQAREKKLAHRIEVAQRAVVARDQRPGRLDVGEHRRGVGMCHESVHHRWIQRAEDRGAAEEILAARRLGTEQRLDLHVEGGLSLRQLLIGLVEAVADHLGEVQDEARILLHEAVELLLRQAPQLDVGARHHRRRARPVGEQGALAEPLVGAVDRDHFALIRALVDQHLALARLDDVEITRHVALETDHRAGGMLLLTHVGNDLGEAARREVGEDRDAPQDGGQ